MPGILEIGACAVLVALLGWAVWCLCLALRLWSVERREGVQHGWRLQRSRRAFRGDPPTLNFRGRDRAPNRTKPQPVRRPGRGRAEVVR
jgi:hypothetical protein